MRPFFPTLYVFFPPVKSSLVQDQQSMKIVINHQKPEIKTAWQAANHSQIFPPRPALLTVFIVPSYLFVFRYNLPYTPRHRDVGKRRQTRLVAAARRTLTSFSSREATLKLLKALVCQAERLDVTIHSSWQATGERGRVFSPPPFFSLSFFSASF